MFGGRAAPMTWMSNAFTNGSAPWFSWRRPVPSDLGRRIRLEGVDASAIVDLRLDNIIKDVIPGHTVQFVHESFLNGAFLHLLIDRDAEWLDEIRAVGEPPVLGRVIELFSQATLAQRGDWEQKLTAVENSGMRPQWTRAWLIAPFGAPTFWNRSGTSRRPSFRTKRNGSPNLQFGFKRKRHGQIRMFSIALSGRPNWAARNCSVG